MPDHTPSAGPGARYEGPTYYGRPSLKPAPFNKVMVGSYIFLAGLSGAAQLLSTLADLKGGAGARGVVRRGRYLALPGLTLGTALLIADLHTPQRFYNMLRIFRRTSPMSIGSYILTGFGLFAGLTAGLQFLIDTVGGRRWLRPVARVTQIPAAIAGAGLGSYTAALLSATSTPLWAASPCTLAARFAGSAMASGAAALSLGEHRGGSRATARALDKMALAGLWVELGAAVVEDQSWRERGLSARSGPWGMVDRLGATGLGTALPAGLYAASLLLGRRGRRLSRAASMLALGGSLAMRIAVLGSGADSAQRPRDSFALARRRNLPDKP